MGTAVSMLRAVGLLVLTDVAIAQRFETPPTELNLFPLNIRSSPAVNKACALGNTCFDNAILTATSLLGMSTASGKRRAFVSVNNPGGVGGVQGGVAVIDTSTGLVEKFFAAKFGAVTQPVAVTHNGDAFFFVADAPRNPNNPRNAYLYRRNLTDLSDQVTNWQKGISLIKDCSDTDTYRGLTKPLLVDGDGVVLVGDTNGRVTAVRSECLPTDPVCATQDRAELWHYSTESCIRGDLGYDAGGSTISVVTVQGIVHLLQAQLPNPPADSPASTKVVLIVIGVVAGILVALAVGACVVVVIFLAATGRLASIFNSLTKKSAGGSEPLVGDAPAYAPPVPEDAYSFEEPAEAPAASSFAASSAPDRVHSPFTGRS